MVKRYFWNILISIDQLANTFLFGSPDETISSRMGKHIAKKEDKCHICWFVCRFLDLFEKDHCKKSIEKDEGEPM